MIANENDSQYRTNPKFFILFMFLILGICSNAGHIITNHINATHISGNSYLITADAYSVCNGGTAFPSINVTCGTTVQSHTLSPVVYVNRGPYQFGGPYTPVRYGSTQASDSKEVSQVCDFILNPNTTSNTKCRNSNSTITGYVRFRASKIISLPSCASVIISTGNGLRVRSNLTSSQVYNELIINTAQFSKNLFCESYERQTPNQFAKVGEDYNFPILVSNPDNDSLTYKLVCSLLGNGRPNSRISGICVNPMPIANSKINSKTGVYTFRPATTGNKVVAVQIVEYDRKTKLAKATHHKEFVFDVKVGLNSAPKRASKIAAVTGATRVDSFHINSCGGGFSIIDTLTDVNNLQNIHVLSDVNEKIPGSKVEVVTVSSSPIKKSIVKFTISDAAEAGNYRIFAQATDDFCNEIGSAYFKYEITVNRRCKVSGALEGCIGDTLRLWAQQKGKYRWYSIAGDSLQFSGTGQNIWLDTLNGDTNRSLSMVFNKTTTLVCEDLSFISQPGISQCVKYDTVKIQIGNNFNLKVTNDTTLCHDLDSFSVSCVPDSSFNYSYQWYPTKNFFKPNTSRPTYHSINAQKLEVKVRSDSGCTKKEALNISIAPQLNQYVLSSKCNDLCPGSATELKLTRESACGSNKKFLQSSSLVFPKTNNKPTSSIGSFATDWPNPFNGSRGYTTQEYLYKKADLTQMGINGAAYFESISFFVVDIFSTDTVPNFRIQMSNSLDTAVSSWEKELCNVFNSKNVKLKSGWNTFKLDNPFYYNGQSNLKIRTCMGDGNQLIKNTIALDTVGYAASYTFAQSFPNCENPNVLTFSNFKARPLVSIGFQDTISSSNTRVSWGAHASFTPTSKFMGNAQPNSTTSYFVYLEDLVNGCRDTLEKIIRANPINIIAQDSAVSCINDTVHLSAKTNLPSKKDGYFFWSNQLGQIISTNDSLKQSITKNERVFVSYKDSCGCNLNKGVNLLVAEKPNFNLPQYGPYCKIQDSVKLNTNLPGYFVGEGVDSTTSFLQLNSFNFRPTHKEPDTVPISYKVYEYCIWDTIIPIIIKQPFNPQFLYSGGVKCINSSPRQFRTGISGYVYSNSGQWSGSGIDSSGFFDPKIAGLGSHTIKVDSSGNCGDTNSFTIRINDVPVIPIDSSYSNCANAKSVSVNAFHSSIDEYEWSTGKKGSWVDKELFKNAGSYWVKATSVYGCIDTAFFRITEDPCAGVSISNQNTINIYPNPASNIVRLLGVEVQKIKTFKLFNALGVEEAVTLNKTTNGASIDISGLTIGTYFFELIYKDGSKFTNALIKQAE